MVWNWVVAHIDDFKKQINYWCIDLRRNSYWPVLMSYFICCVQSLPHCCLKVSFTVMSLFQVKWHFPHHSFVPHLSYARKLNLDIKMIAVCCSSMGMTGREYEFIWVWLNGNGQTHLSWLALQTLNKYKLLGGNSSISWQILGLCETIYDSISGGFAHWDFTSVSRSSGLDVCLRSCWVFYWSKKAGMWSGLCLKGAIRHRAQFGETLERWKLTLEVYISFHP